MTIVKKKPRQRKKPAVPQRDERGRLLPGSTANPGGMHKSIRDIREIARRHSPKAMGKLYEIMMSTTDEKAAIAAAKILLAYGIGLPAIEIKNDTQAPIEEIEKRVVEIMAQRRVAGAKRVVDA